jgi:hypothetical protein
MPNIRLACLLDEVGSDAVAERHQRSYGEKLGRPKKNGS